VVNSNPGPTTASPLARWCSRRMTISRHPEPCVDPPPPWRVESDSRFALSIDAPSDGFTRRSSLRPRSPFTRPCRFFWSAFAELIRDRASPYRLLQLHFDVRATKPELLILAGRRPRSPSLSFVSRPPPCGGGDTRRIALVRTIEPQCWFLPLARICPTLMPTDRPTTVDCSCGV